MPGGLWASVNHTVLSHLSPSLSLHLISSEAHSLSGLQHCDLERVLEILTSKDLNETLSDPSDHPSSRTERLHNAIYTQQCRTLTSLLLDCCKTQKNASEKEKSVLVWLLETCSRDISYKSETNTWSDDKNETFRASRPKPPIYQFVDFNIWRAHIIRTYSSDRNPALESEPVFALLPFHV